MRGKWWASQLGAVALVAGVAHFRGRAAVGAEAMAPVPGEQRTRVASQRRLVGRQLGGGLPQTGRPPPLRLGAAHVVGEQRRVARDAKEYGVLARRREQQPRTVEPDPALRHQHRPRRRIRPPRGKPLRPPPLHRSAIEGGTGERDHAPTLMRVAASAGDGLGGRIDDREQVGGTAEFK